MSLGQNLISVRKQIEHAEISGNRKPGSVLLLAVSKQQPVEAIIEAYDGGVRHFGENYLQEAQQKMSQLRELPICWHFIGSVQGNKAKYIANHFDWVHSINRAQIAIALNDHRSPLREPLQVCLQINLVEEKSKAGIPVEQAMDLALQVNQLPHLKLRGLMTIPPPQEQEPYALFVQLRRLMESINLKTGMNMDTLSMGMSDDLIPAIKAGSTLVRVGRAIFGEREGKIK